MSVELSSIKFHEYPLRISRIITCGQPDRVKLACTFLQFFAVGPPKMTVMKQHTILDTKLEHVTAETIGTSIIQTREVSAHGHYLNVHVKCVKTYFKMLYHGQEKNECALGCL